MVARSEALALALVSLVAPSIALHAQPDEQRSESIREGKSLYRTWCASCHGREARGDGPLAAHLRVPPTDLTGLTRNNAGRYPYARVERLIDGRDSAGAHGGPDMPVWGDAFERSLQDEAKVKARIESLVDFLRSIQQVTG